VSSISLVRRAGVVLVVVALLFAGPAVAAKSKKRKGKTWASAITLVHSVGTEFSGVVSSELDACRAQRLVTVYYTDPHTGQTLPLSVQRTNGNGRYQVILLTLAYAGSYQARVSQRRMRAMKAPQTCRAAQSSLVPV